MAKVDTETLVSLGLLKPWKQGFVLTRQGQKVYGGTDPYFWKQCNREKVYESTEEGIKAFCEIMGLPQPETPPLES